MYGLIDGLIGGSLQLIRIYQLNKTIVAFVWRCSLRYVKK